MKKIRAIVMAMMVIVMLISLSACFLPEDFDASITVRHDGSYTFKYEGNLVHALALSSIKEGKFAKKDEAELKQYAKEMVNQPGFKKVNYIGNARYKVLVDQSGKAGEDYYFTAKDMSIFSILTQTDTTMAIKALKLNANDLKMLKDLDFDIVGTLTVSVEKGVKVLEHNADKVSAGIYQWRIKNPEEAPRIIVKP